MSKLNDKVNGATKSPDTDENSASGASEGSKPEERNGSGAAQSKTVPFQLAKCRKIELPVNTGKPVVLGGGTAVEPAIEAYKTLRTRLVRAQSGRGIKSVVITSAAQGDGKTLTTFTPALVALGGREDVTMIVTTGGQPIESIPVAIPANARIASFLPYSQVMREIDLLITNGGYGTVNMAISHGIPIISAGLTEDKEEVSAHVQWSGAGIDLRANEVTPEAIKHAVDEIFTQPGYRERAHQLSLEFADHDVEVELLSLIEECVPDTVNA